MGRVVGASAGQAQATARTIGCLKYRSSRALVLRQNADAETFLDAMPMTKEKMIAA
jgi:hypothetical protein